MGEAERGDTRNCPMCGKVIYYGQFCTNDCADVFGSLTAAVWEPPDWWPRCSICEALKVINGSWTAFCLKCDALDLQPAWDYMPTELKARIAALCEPPPPRHKRRGKG